MLRLLMLNNSYCKPSSKSRSGFCRLLDFVTASAATFLLALVFSAPAIATNNDHEKPIHIEAGKLVIKEKQGISHYSGHVKISQGSRIISGDSVSIHSENSKISKIIIKGTPASFSQLNELNEKTQASAEEMVFYVDNEILVMTKNAILQQKGNVFSSEKISYNTADDIMIAGDSNTPDNERVKITIHPKKDSHTNQ